MFYLRNLRISTQIRTFLKSGVAVLHLLRDGRALFESLMRLAGPELPQVFLALLDPQVQLLLILFELFHLVVHLLELTHV